MLIEFGLQIIRLVLLVLYVLNARALLLIISIASANWIDYYFIMNDIMTKWIMLPCQPVYK